MTSVIPKFVPGDAISQAIRLETAGLTPEELELLVNNTPFRENYKQRAAIYLRDRQPKPNEPHVDEQTKDYVPKHAGHMV